MDRAALDRGWRRLPVNWLAQHIKHASKGQRAHWDMHSPSSPRDGRAARQTLRVAQGNGASGRWAQQILDLQDQGLPPVYHPQSFMEARQLVGEKCYVNHWAVDGQDPASSFRRDRHVVLSFSGCRQCGVGAAETARIHGRGRTSWVPVGFIKAEASIF
jgi:hypothetical protein